MNKRIIVDIESKENIEISKSSLNKILEIATENIHTPDFKARIRVE